MVSRSRTEFIGDEIECKRWPASKVHGINIVAGIVERLASCGLSVSGGAISASSAPL